MNIPYAKGSAEETAYFTGARDEAHLCKEGRTKAGLELMQLIDGMAQYPSEHRWGRADEGDLALCATEIYLAGSRRRLLAAAWTLGRQALGGHP